MKDINISLLEEKKKLENIQEPFQTDKNPKYHNTIQTNTT